MISPYSEAEGITTQVEAQRLHSQKIESNLESAQYASVKGSAAPYDSDRVDALYSTILANSKAQRSVGSRSRAGKIASSALQ